MLFRFNTESYGENGAWRLKNTPAGNLAKAKCQSSEPTPSLSKHRFGIGSHSLWAYCLLRENKLERSSRTFNRVHRFLHIQMQ